MLNWKKNVRPICTKVLFLLVGIIRESEMGSPAFEPLAMCPKAGHFSLTISSGFQLPPLLIIIIILFEGDVLAPTEQTLYPSFHYYSFNPVCLKDFCIFKHLLLKSTNCGKRS